jgi:SAM-dependent methyltransferase
MEMNNALWEKYTSEITKLDYNNKFHTEPAPLANENHLHQTYKFFKELGIDNKNKQLLDIGAQGPTLKNNIESNYTGCDIRIYEGLDLVDAHFLPYKDKTFDIIFSSHTLEHTLSPAICLWEMKRVIKDNGDIVIGVPTYPGFLDPGHFYLLTFGGWKNMFEALKFEIIKEKGGDNEHIACFHLKIKNEVKS